MNEKIDKLILNGNDVLFGVVCDGPMAEMIKYEIITSRINNDDSAYWEGFGQNSVKAFENAYARFCCHVGILGKIN